jgi:hypothetical protein
MLELDGTDNKGKLGANAILGVSLAVSKAGAAAKKVGRAGKQAGRQAGRQALTRESVNRRLPPSGGCWFSCDLDSDTDVPHAPCSSSCSSF